MKLAPRGVEGDVAGGEVGGGALGREGQALEVLRQPPPVGVVDVDDRRFRPQLGEEPALGEEVVLHVGVEVEVVLGQVGEQGQLEADRVDPVQGERVRGDLHRAGAVAALEHAAEGLLEVDRLRGRALDLLLDRADHLLDGAQQARLDRRRLEHLAEQEGGRRLAVGAGDPRHPQLGRRVAVEARRDRRHRRPRVGDHDLRHPQLGQLALDDQRRGAGVRPPPAANSCPSAFSPTTQKKSVPGSTRRLS